MNFFSKIICMSAFAAFFITGCASDSSDEQALSVSGSGSSVTEIITDYDSEEKDVSSSSAYSPVSDSRDIKNNPGDKVGAVTVGGTIYVNLTDKTYSEDGSSYTAFTEDDAAVLSSVKLRIDDGVLTVNSSGYENNLKIEISGSISAGSVYIKTAACPVVVLLKNVSISSGNYPCMEVKGDVTKTYLVLEGENIFEDGRSYGTGYSSAEGKSYYTSSYTGDKTGCELTQNWKKGSDTKGTLYSKGALFFSGSGSLSVTEKYKHAVYSKDYIWLADDFTGSLTVSSSGRNGIQSVNGFIMDSGSVSIIGTGTYTNNESRGIIVEGSENYAGEGFVVINGGILDIKTVGKAVSAKWDIDDDAETEEITDDPYPYVLVTGGTINIETTGTPADESETTVEFKDADGVSVTETTKLSPEGIEGKQDVFITGGKIILKTTDDCINSSNSSGVIRISGGNIYAYSSVNDAVDSNGELYISGGLMVALAKTAPECAFDCDNNTFAITGGLFVGVGTNNYTEPTSSKCTQSVVVLSGDKFGAGGTAFAVEESDGTPVFVYDIPSDIFGTQTNSSYVMVFSSPRIKTGTSYRAVSGISSSGGEYFYGLYTDLPSVSGGSVKDSSVKTTDSSYVYTSISVSNGGAQEGAQPGNGGMGR